MEDANPNGKKARQKETKERILVHWSLSTLLSRARPGPTRHAVMHSSIHCQRETLNGYFSTRCVELVFLVHLHAKVWCSVPSTTIGSPWTGLCLFFWFLMVLPQRLDDSHDVVGVVGFTVSHLQQLRSKSAGPSRKVSVPARSRTRTSLLARYDAGFSRCWRPLSLWLASAKVVPDPPTASPKRDCLLAVCLLLLTDFLPPPPPQHSLTHCTTTPTHVHFHLLTRHSPSGLPANTPRGPKKPSHGPRSHQ